MEALKERLCEQCGTYDGKNFKEKALVKALEVKHDKCIEELIVAGADVNGTDYSTLMSAASEGNAECVDVLLKAGADVNQRTQERNFAAIIGAAMAGSVECTELLIAAGANVNVRHLYERSAIIQAVKNGYPKVVKILLEAGANVNDTEYNGEYSLAELEVEFLA